MNFRFKKTKSKSKMIIKPIYVVFNSHYYDEIMKFLYLLKTNTQDFYYLKKHLIQLNSKNSEVNEFNVTQLDKEYLNGNKFHGFICRIDGELDHQQLIQNLHTELSQLYIKININLNQQFTDLHYHMHMFQGNFIQEINYNIHRNEFHDENEYIQLANVSRNFYK